MNALILAAGVGSRLRPLTDRVPKCLVPVGTRPVLEWQINALLASGVDHITVVAGYRASDVVAFCERFGEAVTVLVNEEYDRTNNMYSLWLALKAIDPQPVILCNGDVVFDGQIANSLISDARPNLIAVEPGRYIAESMKVAVDERGRIVRLSKAVPQDEAFAVSIDLYRFDAAAMSALLQTADRMIRAEGQRNLWTEVAIEAMLPEIAVEPLDIRSRRWIEIDNYDDLSEGERLFSVSTV